MRKINVRLAISISIDLFGRLTFRAGIQRILQRINKYHLGRRRTRIISWRCVAITLFVAVTSHVACGLEGQFYLWRCRNLWRCAVAASSQFGNLFRMPRIRWPLTPAPHSWPCTATSPLFFATSYSGRSTYDMPTQLGPCALSNLVPGLPSSIARISCAQISSVSLYRYAIW